MKYRFLSYLIIAMPISTAFAENIVLTPGEIIVFNGNCDPYAVDYDPYVCEEIKFDGNCDPYSVDKTPYVCESDFTGDHLEDILFSDPILGKLSVMSIKDDLTVEETQLPDVSSGTSVLGVEDYSGNHMPEIYFYNQFFGQLNIWNMTDQLSIESSNTMGYLPPNGYISNIRIGDFNGDNAVDYIYNYYNFFIQITSSNGNSLIGSNIILNQPTGTVVGIGDFDNDGDSDVLYRDGNKIYGLTIEESKLEDQTLIGNLPNSWKVGGVGDFDFDGNADIAIYNSNSGNARIVLMNGFDEISNIGTISININSEIIAVDDFDGDQHSDLALRDMATGEIDLRTINGITLKNAFDNIAQKDVNWIAAP